MIFAWKPTALTLDEGVYTIGRDGIMPLSPGLHRIGANETIVIQLILRYSGTGGFIADTYAAYPVSIQGLKLSYPPPPQVGEGEMTPYYYVGIAAVAIAIVAFALRRKVSRRQPRP